ncbi:uridine phosphorylase [Gillisia mitskevichiae]|uniref:Uridine phosphorylase n=1 Tax=Gillisia mitskevichiae TaxID=270921 RepID=A0A495PR46_9FLAO|nr:nucleoside phosphorylase [Gillisia mitskevichiae]RKS53114.1 uridine phosphorylase [Gillisia mitskevichiae]
MTLKPSEFILNEDGSIYHLNLLPNQLATTVITVGDPDRVNNITKHFDTIEHIVHKREFHTQTGMYKGKRISVISTGIGTDNIDIVFNELDALVNIDFKTRKVKKNLTSLDIIRIGTSGSIQADIPIDAFLVSETAVGFDSLLHFYKSEEIQDIKFSKLLLEHLILPRENGLPYVVNADVRLLSYFEKDYFKGITVTNCGFYGPQGRVLRLPLSNPNLNDRMAHFNYKDRRITNLEMETAGIYGLSKLLGHRALSLNAIVANRATGEFSKDPTATVERLIVDALDRIASIEAVI